MANQYTTQVTDGEIAQLLDGACSDRAIARALQVSTSRVRRVREAQGTPMVPKGRPPRYTSLTDLFTQNTVATDDGHLEWTGPTTGASDSPIYHYGSVTGSVNRAAFEEFFGRAPEGYVRSFCGHSGCIKGAHLWDRRMRQDILNRPGTGPATPAITDVSTEGDLL